MKVLTCEHLDLISGGRNGSGNAWGVLGDHVLPDTASSNATPSNQTFDAEGPASDTASWNQG